MYRRRRPIKNVNGTTRRDLAPVLCTTHPSWGRTEQKELKRSPLDLALFFTKEGIADGKVCILYISITRYRSWSVTAETDDGLDRGVSRSMERDKTTPVTLLVLIWCIVLFILIGKG